jgi:CTP:molybdopterin cytidylyltransferase MocA
VVTRAVAGVVLAAGAGVRLGFDAPKPLVTDSAGRTWLDRSISALQDGGVPLVYVVVGAGAAAVEAAVPPGCHVVFAPEWAEGMGASLRAGLGAVRLHSPTASAAVIMLVDTPGVGAEVVRRLVEHAQANRQLIDSLVRAAYGGDPGHPVLIGQAHWAGVLDSASGDRGARDYLATAPVQLVECGDIGSGADIDTPEALAAWSRRSRQARPPG